MGLLKRIATIAQRQRGGDYRGGALTSERLKEVYSLKPPTTNALGPESAVQALGKESDSGREQEFAVVVRFYASSSRMAERVTHEIAEVLDDELLGRTPVVSQPVPVKGPRDLFPGAA